MRRFSVFKRSSGIYYAELYDPETHARIASKSTGKRDRVEAIIVANDWANNGLPDSNGTRKTIGQISSVAEILRALKETQFSQADLIQIVRILRLRGLIDKEACPQGGPTAESFGAWLRAFWRYDSSPYIAERLAHGQRATKRHCQDMEGRAKEIEGLLGSDLRLGEIRRTHLVDLGLKLKARGLAAATINKTMSAATTALRWATANDIIPNDPTRGLRNFSGQRKRRGILEPTEVKALFSATWEDERARVACLVAATTGARLGEILALQRQDIGEDRLFIRHSYSINDGLKSPKNGEEREVPLLPTVRAALLALDENNLLYIKKQCARTCLDQYQHHASTGPERFIFMGKLPDRPIDANRILLGMRKAIVAMNGKQWGSDKDPQIKQERNAILAEYAERGIDFHSWRHWYAKTMSDRLDPKIVQRATGHKTAAMLEHYANHILADDLARLGVVASESFAAIIQ